MRAVIQRVSQAAVSVAGRVLGRIGPGLVVFVAVRAGDRPAQAVKLAERIVGLRVFPDAAGKMNLSLKDARGSVLAVSQFTLYGDCRRGHRPGFSAAAPPADAVPVYERFISALRAAGAEVATGEFGALMAVSVVNEGPVTIILDDD